MRCTWHLSLVLLSQLICLPSSYAQDLVIGPGGQATFRQASRDEVMEMLRTTKYMGLEVGIAARFEEAVNRLSIANTFHYLFSIESFNSSNRDELERLVDDRVSAINQMLRETWARLANSPDTEELIKTELLVFITDETIRELRFIEELNDVLTTLQKSALLRHVAKNIYFADRIYCVEEFTLTPSQRMLFNAAGDAINPRGKAFNDDDFLDRMDTALKSLDYDQLKLVAMAKGIIPQASTLRESYLLLSDKRKQILADNFRHFAAVRDRIAEEDEQCDETKSPSSD